MPKKKSLPPILRLTTSPPSSNSLTKDSIVVTEEEPKKDEPPTPDSPTMDHFVPSRPLSVAIPQRTPGAQAPYFPRRPNLSDILANTAPPPWTLSAFMAYLSQNHCLETLEFTMDASRYRKHYTKMAARSPGGQVTPGTEECNYLRMLWKRLVEAYIAPNGPREVNLPSHVRDGILEISRGQLPPPPSALEPAVEHVYELMEESVLVPFLNSFYDPPAQAEAAYDSSEDAARLSSHSFDDRENRRPRRSPRNSRRASPPNSASQQHARASAPPSSFSQFARTLSQSTRHTFSHSHSHSQTSDPTSRSTSSALTPLSGYPSSQDFGGNSPVDSAIADLTEGSASSPSAFGEPMTPPTTPPMCEFGGMAYGGSPTGTNAVPVGVGRGVQSHNPWQKMRTSLGFNKKRGGGAGMSFREDEEMEYH